MPPLRLAISSSAAARAAVAAAAAASLMAGGDTVYADSPFRIPYLSSRPPATNPPPEASDGQPSADGSSEGSSSSTAFDPEALEQMAKHLREIKNSPYSKEVFKLMREQEKARLVEVDVEKAQVHALQSKEDIERQRKLAEEQRNLLQQQAQVKAQNMRNEDELARKRMQTEHEAQRRLNVERVKMEEESSLRREQARRAAEEKIQAQVLQTEKEKAVIERQTFKDKKMAEAEAGIYEKKQTEEQQRMMLLEEMKGEKEKWMAAINTTFNHIEGGFRTLLTDRSKLTMSVLAVTGLAAGVYTTREGARVTWGYINRILGQPSLIRESSMAKFPWSRVSSSILKKASGSGTSSGNGASFERIILHPSLKRRIEQLARATENTKSHEAPFRNMLFYGPPGTGKTLVAREMARKSGLDYAMMTGGDVAPLGSEAVTKIHQIFDWAKNSRKGLLLFIDEADAFLCERNSIHMSEAQRSALNALLFRTGDQSRDIVLVLATNRPGDLDAAVTDRIDEVLGFPLPGEEERFKLLKLYVNQYISREENARPWWRSLFKKNQQKIVIKDVTEDVLLEAAKKTEGFSGREIAKLVASIQAAVYGRLDCTLDSQLFMEIVDYKVAEHHQRIKLAAGTS